MLSGAAVLLLAQLAAAASTADAADVVKLPEFVVKADLPWTYVELPRFEVVSIANEKATERYVRELHRQVNMLESLFPPRFLQHPGTKALAVLHTYENHEDKMPPGSPRLSTRWRWHGVSNDNYSGATLSDRTDYDTPTFTVNVVWFESHSYTGRRLRLETAVRYVFWELDCRKPKAPEWLKVGLAHALEAAAVTDDALTLIPSTNIDLSHRKEREAVPLSIQRPLERNALTLESGLGSMNREAPDEAMDATYFVRWGLLNKEYTSRFWTFVQRACEENVTEAMFTECFGFGYAEANRRILNFFPNGDRFTRIGMPKEELDKIPPLQLRPARPSELGRIIGEWRRQAAFLEEDPARFAAAIEHARTSILNTLPRVEDPRSLATLGICEKDAGKNEDALKHLEAAVRAKVVRPRAYLDYARLLFERATAGQKDATAKLDAEQTSAILDPLRTGGTQTPALNGTYRLAADVWTRSSVEPTGEDLAFIEEGTRLFPRDSQLAIAAIRLHARHGLKSEASAIANRWLKTVDAKTRKQFEAAGFKPGS